MASGRDGHSDQGVDAGVDRVAPGPPPSLRPPGQRRAGGLPSPALRSWAKGHLLIGPSFPQTRHPPGDRQRGSARSTTPSPSWGTRARSCSSRAPAASRSGPPGDLARGAWGPVWRGALKQAWKSSPSVVLLASVAGVLVDSGMVRTVAQGAAVATGARVPGHRPARGRPGFVHHRARPRAPTRSSPRLQADVAHLIGEPPADLLAGQLAGGNIGNSLAPVVILLGLSAVGGTGRTGEVLRMTLRPRPSCCSRPWPRRCS